MALQAPARPAFPAARLPPPAPGAGFAVAVLTAVNLLNYADRFITSAVKDLFKRDLHLSDTETSLPLSAFIVVYMITSPLFGSLGDRLPRKKILAAGAALWSAATGLAGLATGFWSLVISRALVGIGEAAYVSLCPSLFSDFYPPAKRNRILTLFYTAVPVGLALGYVAGGLIGHHLGWRAAFMICGFPGVFAAGLVLLIREPPRGIYDNSRPVSPPSWLEVLRSLVKNREYVLAVAGYTAVTFAGGAMGDWLPTYLSRSRGMNIGEAGSAMGITMIVGGLGGTLLGGFGADLLGRFTRRPYLALSALSTVAAALFAMLTIVLENRLAILTCMFFAQLFMWFYNAPINAVLINLVDGHSRARAFALAVLVTHMLGDALSPPIAGYIADLTGSVGLALTLTPVGLLVAALLWAVAWRAPEEAHATVAVSTAA
ncbi:MFS transporter [Sorangium sp. So ce281]|uniref:spinster family MFS transporter n=1 Tax=unclassified Sorangium TaxID=2621164 RepID=UPI003F606702